MSRAPARAAPPPPPPEDGDGASANERLLAAAKTDNEDLLQSALESPSTNINFADGLGNTALHYAIINGSTDVLEHILEHDQCDPDIRNRLDGDTPLHIAVRQRWEQQPGMRLYLVGSLLEAGADMLIKNRHNERAIDLLPPYREGADQDSDDEKVRAMIRRAQAETSVAAAGDVVEEDDDVFDPNDVASDSD